MHAAVGIGRVVHAEGEVEAAQGIARNLVDFGIEERAESGIHGDGSGVAVGQIHACGQHGDGQLASLLDAHGLQLAAHLHILRGV